MLYIAPILCDIPMVDALKIKKIHFNRKKEEQIHVILICIYMLVCMLLFSL
jgi:hypothetical protein